MDTAENKIYASSWISQILLPTYPILAIIYCLSVMTLTIEFSRRLLTPKFVWSESRLMLHICFSAQPRARSFQLQPCNSSQHETYVVYAVYRNIFSIANYMLKELLIQYKYQYIFMLADRTHVFPTHRYSACVTYLQTQRPFHLLTDTEPVSPTHRHSACVIYSQIESLWSQPLGKQVYEWERRQAGMRL